MGASNGRTIRQGMIHSPIAAAFTIAVAVNSSGESESPAADSTFVIRLLLYASMRIYRESRTAAFRSRASVVLGLALACFPADSIAFWVARVGRCSRSAAMKKSPADRRTPNKNR